jgi:signal transduction histidine kinase
MKELNLFSEVHDSILTLTPHIIQEWEGLVRANIQEAKLGPSLILRDHLPEFLKKLAMIFESKECSSSTNLWGSYNWGGSHGQQRATSLNYTLEALLKEYSILRSILLEKLFPKGSSDLKVSRLLHESLDQAVQNSALEYVRIQNERKQEYIEELKNEKYLRETFVSALSHDLRTPLSAAKMSAQMILRKPEAADLPKQMPRIIANIDRIDGMIQNLLDANLIKVGQALPIDIHSCELQKIIDESVTDLRSIHGSRFQITHHQNVTGHWSQSAIRRMVENLCTNAIKYGDPESMVNITTSERDQDVFISVHNCGEAISPQDLNRLFRPFHRSSSAKCSGKKGWGIGLSLVQGLARAHGGEVGVESQPKEGTTFRIRLPKDARFVDRRAAP